ncbi:MAG: hypothetical protein QOF76_2424 [Solirubrobacteraceae bacterium]|nr:hypothetical protein [Solirubrobacteraceae bacterium]
MASDAVIAHLTAALATPPKPLVTHGLSPAAVAKLAGLPPLLQDIYAFSNGMTFLEDALSFPTPVEEGRRRRLVTDSLLHLWDIERMVEEDDADTEWVPPGLIPLGVGWQDGVVLVSERMQDAGWVYYWDAHWQSRARRDYWQERIDRLPWTADENEARVVRLNVDLERWLLSLGDPLSG